MTPRHHARQRFITTFGPLFAALMALSVLAGTGESTPESGSQEPESAEQKRAEGARRPYTTVNPLLRNAPGYTLPADPESLSVIRGRRLNAPLVDMPFGGGAQSMSELGHALCWALHHTSKDSIEALTLTSEEFNGIMWREFPQSRPITGIQGEDAFWLLDGRNKGGTSRALDTWGDRYLQFVRWERHDTTAVYKNFKLHNGLEMVVIDDQGHEQRLDIVRSVGERKGRFKIYAMKD